LEGWKKRWKDEKRGALNNKSIFIFQFFQSQQVRMPAEAKKVARFLTGFLGPEKCKRALKSFELYDYFMRHLDTPAEKVAARLPGFTRANVLEIQRTLKLQHGLRGRQAGGAESTTPVANEAVVASEKEEKEEDKTQELYDKIFGRMGAIFPPSWDRFFYYLFFLHAIENAKFIGPLATTFFDSISLTLPTVGEGIGTALDVGSTVLLSAIPGAAIAAPVIGYIPELLLGLIAINMDMSRKRFSQAFKKMLDLVPLLGETLSQAAVNFEVFLKNYEASRERLVKEAADLSPSVAKSLACVLPLVTKTEEGCPHPFDNEAIKAEMEVRVFKEMPFLKMMGITRFEQLTPSGVLEALKSKVRSAVPSVPSMPTNTASAATALARGVASRSLPVALPTNTATAATALARGVGSRALTLPTRKQRRLRHNRTQRRRY
jgi:hypothetical protein